MNKLIEAGRQAVNSKALRRFGSLRQGLKKAFVSAAGSVSSGTKVQLAEGRTVVVPWDLVGATRWQEYEPLSTEFFARLIDKSPDLFVADVGCAIGIYSLLALSVSDRTTVYSMDSDLMALTMARHMCRATARGRHELLWGFCGDEEMSKANPLRSDLTAALASSAQVVDKAGLKPRIGANSYNCIGGDDAEGVPFWDMDSLFVPMAKTGRPMLLKVDIEGAEIAMVRGSCELADYPNVQMLLSVHAHVLPSWRSSAQEIRNILEGRGYQITLVEETSEQHWWVRKAS